jgi:membrane protein DedA with SNARE-associated domain
MLESAWIWVQQTVEGFGYTGIVVMMFLESSFFPFPSEIVMIPGGAVARNGSFDVGLVIVCGILGSILGAVFNYLLAVKLGRPILIRFGKYFFINAGRIEKAERYFRAHGEIGTFVGRLIPGVRQYISFPAGLARMKMGRFVFYTALGAGIWCTILTLIGYYLGNTDLGTKAAKTATLWLFVGVVLLVGLYVFVHRRRRRRREAAS